MVQIAFLLLCHKDPQAVIEKARQLTAAGDRVAIHYDGRAPEAEFARIREALADNRSVAFAGRRVTCGWGEWSLVEATLLTARAALAAFPEASHLYLISGDCMAIKSAAYAHALLAAREVDYIESTDFHTGGWIRTGLKDERLVYRHWFNERSRKRLFYASMALQKRLGLRRSPPADLDMRIGSQWWCLRRATVEAVLAFLAERRDVTRFFRTTWIPDETVFQTLVRHLVPASEIESRTPTFLMFTDYGLPVTFYNDHYDLLLGQDYLFARKISPEARELKKRLGRLWASGRTEFAITGEGRRLFDFLVGRGRVGRRFAPRFWETEGTLGRERELLILACRKWEVARRLAREITEQTGVPNLGFVFNETDAPLPDLGGIQSTVEKRHRHRRALLRMLFDTHGTDRLVICLDSSARDLMQDFFSDRTTVRLLEIDCEFSDADLHAHAVRMGLAGAEAGAATLAQLLPTIRQELAHDTERLRDAGFANHTVLREGAPQAANAEALAAFLGIEARAAAPLAARPDLFHD